MSLLIRSRNILGQSIFVLALMSISVFAAEEHKGQAEHASRPSNQGHASQGHAAPSHGSPGNGAPSHASGPSHAAGPSHSSGSSNASASSHGSNQGHTAGNHPQGNTGNRAGGNAGRPGNAGNAGNRGTNAGGNRGANAGGNRGANAGGNRGANAGANRGANAGGNRGMGNRAGNNAGTRAGTNSHTAPGRTVSLKGGGSASIRPNGSIRSVNHNGMQIHNGLHGGRTVVTEHNGTRIVNTGRGGYVQHAYMTRGGRSYYSRTYYNNGVYRTGIYRGYFYGGHAYYGYNPGFWYHPGFYGWAGRPWGFGVSWGIGLGGWGWGGSPWYGFYGGYFAPYPVYASPAFWLTDYLLAADLQSAYAARSEANAEASGAYDQGSANYGDTGGGQPANSGQVALSPEVKQAIAEEVRAQLAEQQQEAGTQGGGNAQAAPAPANGEVPPALDPARRTFVVDNTITVVSDGQECELTGGDVITRLTDTPDADQKVNASVSASKKGECLEGKQVVVSVDDLQEMHNHFEEQLNNGLKTLAEKQGTGGLPKAPDTGTVASDVPPPPTDDTAAKQLADQQAQADQAEAQARQEAAAPGGGGQ